ncbi:MAG TPA: M55 family metallopeptidase [Candidatus Saccharimonadales bacterium]|nr:M55 family metallopeptidase [Candidatus Saccharimonadales bacterium]
MRVALWVDMEGTSQIMDHRECWPAFVHYWEYGRPKLANDVVATARGLLAGGVTEVVVVNAHGLGWPNILTDALPSGAKLAIADDWNRDIDATFQVGFHARAGTSGGFISHTMVPDLTVSVDGKAVTESHIWSWVTGVPVLGIVGDDALKAQLDGTLKDIRFLAVKISTGRTQTRPVFSDARQSAEAIEKFAKECAQEKLRKQPDLPPRFTAHITIKPEFAKEVAQQHGLKLIKPGVIEIEAKRWAKDVQPVLEHAMGVASSPWIEAWKDLDLGSKEALQRQDAESIERLRQKFINWAEENR